MRRYDVVSFVFAAGLVMAAIGHTQGHTPAGKSLTVSGTLIDTKCFSMDTRNRGDDHFTEMGEMKGCGTLCARLGIPVGVLAGKDEVWILVTPSQDLADHIGQTAR